VDAVPLRLAESPAITTIWVLLEMRSITPQEGEMSQAPNPNSNFEQPQRQLASSTTQRGKAPPAPEIKQFPQGPQKRGFELWPAVAIFFEIIRGYRHLHFLGPCVTVFGSARFTEEREYYVVAREIGQRLARAGFTVMTGGGLVAGIRSWLA